MEKNVIYKPNYIYSRGFLENAFIQKISNRNINRALSVDKYWQDFRTSEHLFSWRCAFVALVAKNIEYYP